mmetsp:Transcript_26611/g.76371  ORF Transcript_26611/g.76371 Transcript_26611/m.76371 type:complete len:166 (+) Transcript_26611:75-572(+)
MSYPEVGRAGLLNDKGEGYKAFGSAYPMWGPGWKHSTPSTNFELPPALVRYLETDKSGNKFLKFEMDDGEFEEVRLDDYGGPTVLWSDGTTTQMRWWPGMTATEREVAIVTVARKNHQVRLRMKDRNFAKSRQIAGEDAGTALRQKIMPGGKLRDPFLTSYMTKQ